MIMFSSVDFANKKTINTNTFIGLFKNCLNFNNNFMFLKMVKNIERFFMI